MSDVRSSEDSWFIREATLLTMAGPSGLTPLVGNLLIEGRRIAAIGPNVQAPLAAKVIEGRGKLVMPGLVNSHLHSGETFFKGRYERLPLELWMLSAYPIILGPAVPLRLLYLRSLLTAAEALKGGATTICDDFIDRPHYDLDRLESVFSAYDDIGIRANISDSVADLHIFDTMPFARELVPKELQPLINRPPVTPAAYLDFCRAAFARLHGRAGRLHFMVVPSAPQRCSPDMLQACHELAVQFGVPLHTHLLETRTQAVTAHRNYGTTLVDHIGTLGILGRNLSAAHAIWLTDRDIEMVGDAGSSVVHNTLSNLKLGSGIAPVRKLIDAGVNVALGTDGYCSNDTGRMFDVIRAAGTLHNVSSADHHQWVAASEVLKAATINGARSAMLEGEVGSLEAGKQADLICLDLSSPNFFPMNNLANQLVHCENGSSIEWVMVAGEVVVQEGRLTRIDESALKAELQELLPSYLLEVGLSEQANAAYAPHFEAIHQRCNDYALPTDIKARACRP